MSQQNSAVKIALLIATAILSGLCVFVVLYDAAEETETPLETQQGEITEAQSSPSESVVYLEDFEESSEADLALSAIEELAAHPDDPDNPLGIVGVTDEELVSTSLVEIAELLEACTPYALKQKAEPRFLFGLGRAALLHDMDSRAEELLTAAADAGSAAAEAYLARLTDDLEEAESYLQSAASKGFRPANEWLAELNLAIQGSATQSVATSSSSAAVQPSKFDVNIFKQPTFVAGFHSSDFSKLPKSRIHGLAYVTGFMQGFHNQQLLFLMTDPEDMKKLRSLQDPGFLKKVSMLIASNPAYINEMSRHTTNAMGAFFKGMVDVRKNGGSIEEEIAATMKNTSKIETPIAILEEEGAFDAQTLAFMVGTNYEDARRVIDGMKKYLLKLGTDRTDTTVGSGSTMGEVINELLGKPKKR